MKFSVKDNGGGVREPELGPGGWVRLDTWKEEEEWGCTGWEGGLELLSHSKEKSRVVGERLTRRGESICGNSEWQAEGLFL